jgi:hypothetical protein
MNELLTKKKEFEDSIKETEKQIEQLKLFASFQKKHLKLINEQIEVQNANTEQKKG